MKSFWERDIRLLGLQRNLADWDLYLKHFKPHNPSYQPPGEEGSPRTWEASSEAALTAVGKGRGLGRRTEYRTSPRSVAAYFSLQCKMLFAGRGI